MKLIKGAVTVDFLMWVAGTLIAVIVFVGIVWPWLLSIWYGACWSDARTELKGLGHEIEGRIRSSNPNQYLDYELSLGDCIAGVLFINGREERDAYKKLLDAECSEYSGYKSYMIAIPKEAILALKDSTFKEEYEKTYREELESLKDSLKYWDAVKLWIKKKTGRVPPPYCYEFEHEFSASGIGSLPAGLITDWLRSENWNKGETYCLHVSPVSVGTEGGYAYRIIETPCASASSGGLGSGSGE